MVDEILLRKDGKAVKKSSERQKIKATPFLTRQKSLINGGEQTRQSDAESMNSDVNLAKDFSRNDLFENDEFITNEDL